MMVYLIITYMLVIFYYNYWRDNNSNDRGFFDRPIRTIGFIFAPISVPLYVFFKTSTLLYYLLVSLVSGIKHILKKK